MSIAFEKPTIPATFSVPARLDRSWLPPNIKFSISVPDFMYNAPIPLGAWTLWPETESKSTFKSFTSIFISDKAWTASVWKTIFGFFFLTKLQIFFISWIVPTSLLTYITDTKKVSSLIASVTSFASIKPSLSGKI